MEPDAGTQILQLLLSFFNIVVTAAAAFLGAWCTYVFQRRKEREDLQRRIAGNLTILEDDLDLVEDRLTRVAPSVAKIKWEFLNTEGMPTFRADFPIDSLSQIKYDLAFLMPRSLLTRSLVELTTTLSAVKACMEIIPSVLAEVPSNMTKAEFLNRRMKSLDLPIEASKRAEIRLKTLREELQKAKSENLH